MTNKPLGPCLFALALLLGCGEGYSSLRAQRSVAISLEPPVGRQGQRLSVLIAFSVPPAQNEGPISLWEVDFGESIDWDVFSYLGADGQGREQFEVDITISGSARTGYRTITANCWRDILYQGEAEFLVLPLIP